MIALESVDDQHSHGKSIGKYDKISMHMKIVAFINLVITFHHCHFTKYDANSIYYLNSITLLISEHMLTGL